VLLSYQRAGNTMGRTMAVIKTRASRNDPTDRGFVIGPQGIVLDEFLPSTSDSHPRSTGPARTPSA
jgi:hypothetical protein